MTSCFISQFSPPSINRWTFYYQGISSQNPWPVPYDRDVIYGRVPSSKKLTIIPYHAWKLFNNHSFFPICVMTVGFWAFWKMFEISLRKRKKGYMIRKTNDFHYNASLMHTINFFLSERQRPGSLLEDGYRVVGFEWKSELHKLLARHRMGGPRRHLRLQPWGRPTGSSDLGPVTWSLESILHNFDFFVFPFFSFNLGHFKAKTIISYATNTQA
jgi:hypothetical protein